ncbi:MAG TPA: trypsin-like serine protease [Longimicrobium sp.]|nr:trypsin-like serine protease [Longimicrobium sp.]
MRSTQNLALAAALCVAAAACADTTTAPARTSADGARHIVNGTFTGSSFGNVGALMIDFNGNGRVDGDDQACTGSLISPTVFLTAAHCMEGLAAGVQVYVTFEPKLYPAPKTYIAATGWTADPQYGHDQANLHDLAVILLPRGSTKGVTPLKLPPAGYLDRLQAQNGLNNTLFVNVGYGVSASRTGIPSFPYDGTRKYSKSEYMGLQPYWLGLLMNASATGLGGDCYGDSGGPKFIDGRTDMVVATVTTGDYNCRATTWDYRLDTNSAREFLGRFVTLP